MFRAKTKRRIERLEIENALLQKENAAIKKMADEVAEKYQSDMRKNEKQIAKLKVNDDRWRNQTALLVEEIESLRNQVKTLTRKRNKRGQFVKSENA